MKFSKKYYSVEEVCEMYNIEMPEHIKTNEKLRRHNGGEYDIVRNMSSDGTAIFEKQLLGNVIERLINKETYFIKKDMTDVIDIEYEVGLISLATVFGKVELPIGIYPGMKQRARISVKCKLIFK